LIFVKVIDIISVTKHLRWKKMNKILQNKNLLLSIISCVILVAALVIASLAISNNKKAKEAEISESLRVSRIEELSLLEEEEKKTEKQTEKSSDYTIGKYKIATKDDPLGMRLEPNSSSLRIIDIPKGETVKVVAVWEDWGYIVYNQSGGWISMKYLEKAE
jgi:uncharacterized protein YgiM (DUF1202 family)